MAATDTQLKFRITPELKTKLEKAARLHRRSVNMEVVARLERLFAIEEALASQHSSADEAKAELAVSRLLSIGLETPTDPALSRLLRMGGPGDVLENRVAELEQQVKDLLAKQRGG